MNRLGERRALFGVGTLSTSIQVAHYAELLIKPSSAAIRPIDNGVLPIIIYNVASAPNPQPVVHYRTGIALYNLHTVDTRV